MKKLYTLILAVAISFSAAGAHAGIPVIDVTTNVNLGLQYAKQILQYTTQLNELTEAINTVTELSNTYNAITGNRGLGTIMNGSTEQAARRYVPAGYSDVTALSGLSAVPGYATLQSAVTALKTTVTSTPSSTYSGNPGALALFEAQVNALATQQALGESAYGAIVGRTAGIESLIATIGSATDPKAIAEIQARISAEQALVQNEAVRVQTLNYLQQVENAKLVQKEQDMIINRKNYVLPPITF